MKIYPCSRVISCLQLQGKPFQMSNVFFYSSLLFLFAIYGILKMELSFWEQYLNSQELTYSINNQFAFNQVYMVDSKKLKLFFYTEENLNYMGSLMKWGGEVLLLC